MNKVLFVINPIAGGGRTGKLIPKIEEIINKKDIQYEILITKKAKDAIKIAKEGIEKGYDSIVAVGGDGTVNELAQGILESGRSRVSLGIIPTGTGNDLARSLNIPLSIEKALELILEGKKKAIDVGYVNDKLFLNISSIGFDAEVVRNTQKIKKKIKSSIAYTISVLYTFFTFKNKKISLEIDRKVINGDMFLVAIGNGKYYGGGIKILPMSIIDDGYFYICVIKGISKFKFLYSFPTVLKGKHEKLKNEVSFYKAKEVKVVSEDKAYLNVDGEIYNIENEIIFTMSEEKIEVFVES